MTPVPVEHLDGPWAAILITSANAIRALAAHARLPALQRIRVLAVGERTAETARAAGFTEVISAAGDARALAALAAAQPGGTGAPLLYLAGDDRAFDFAEALAQYGIAVHTAVVYRVEAETEFPAGLADSLRSANLDGVLHYSPRSAATYLRCAAGGAMRHAALAPRHFCLSEQVASQIVAAGAAHVSVALRPNEASLFDLLGAD